MTCWEKLASLMISFKNNFFVLSWIQFKTEAADKGLADTMTEKVNPRITEY